VNLLVDTHLLLWAAVATRKLPAEALAILDDPAQPLWFSSASIWEVAIKYALGRSDFSVEPRRLRRGLLNQGWRELAMTGEHALATLDLPSLHKDPFDRILLAQAKTEGITLLTSDATLARYAGVRKV
jgi:PIN domain nuclease of toxin-antitoxin system